MTAFEIGDLLVSKNKGYYCIDLIIKKIDKVIYLHRQVIPRESHLTRKVMRLDIHERACRSWLRTGTKHIPVRS